MSDQRSVAFVLSNQATSSVTGRPIGIWLAELIHPCTEFEAAGLRMELFSPEGGAPHLDDSSDLYVDNGYSADDEISKAFLADAFVAGEPMASHAIRSGNLITGQQQHSGAEAARLVLEVPA